MSESVSSVLTQAETESEIAALQKQIATLQSRCDHRERTAVQRLRIITAQNRELKALRTQNKAMKSALLRISSLGHTAFEAVSATLSRAIDISPFDDDV